MRTDASSKPVPESSADTSIAIDAPMSLRSLRRRAITSSIVAALRLIESRTSGTSTEPATPSLRISRPLSGAKRISFSCGYCDSHPMSAPRSTMPCWMEKTTPGPPEEPAYASATLRSVVVDMKAGSMPPRTPYTSACRKWCGSRPPLTPRYTSEAKVSLDSFTTAELITCMVVVYLLPLQRVSIELRKKGMDDCRPRSTLLYLTKHGPVYMRAPMNSVRSISAASIAFKRPLISPMTSVNWESGLGSRGMAEPRMVSADSRGHSVSRSSLSPFSGSSTNHHSVRDVVHIW